MPRAAPEDREAQPVAAVVEADARVDVAGDMGRGALRGMVTVGEGRRVGGFGHRAQGQLLDQVDGVAVVVAADERDLEIVPALEPGAEAAGGGAGRIDRVVEEVAEEGEAPRVLARHQRVEALELGGGRAVGDRPAGAAEGGGLAEVHVGDEELLAVRPEGGAFGAQLEERAPVMEFEVARGHGGRRRGIAPTINCAHAPRPGPRGARPWRARGPPRTPTRPGRARARPRAGTRGE